MLKQRIITAAVLLALVLGALAAPSPWPLLALWAVSLVAAGWEWARLNGLPGPQALGLGLALALGALLALWMGLEPQLPAEARGRFGALLRALIWLALPLWLALTALLLCSGAALWLRWPAALRVAGGLAGLALVWLTLPLLYGQGGSPMLLLSAMSLVWVADIAAYFTGRALGGRFIARKLAPSVSPNKSWEGALGGAAGTLLLAAVWVAADAAWGGQSLFTRLLSAGDALWLLLCVLLLTAASVLGDLVESQVKRAAGVKDSSGLLPGHGGVLDRVDALLPTLPLALALLGALS